MFVEEAEGLDRKRISLEKRFWPKVDIRGPNDCWEWKGACHPAGHGQIRAGGRSGRVVYAHRVAWELANGPIPEGMCILHRCDNPPCVNLLHLYLGTHVDNLQDAYDRSRRQVVVPDNVGERNSNAKLNREQVVEILDKHASGDYTHAELGAIYGVARPTITDIVNRTTWGHIWDE